RVACAGRWTADGPPGYQGVRRAGVGHAVARLGDVAPARGSAADAGALHIRWTRGARPRAGLRGVARSRRGATHGARRLEHIRRTGVADAVAALGDIAGPGRGTADVGALRNGRARQTRPRPCLG